jgi:hypothetical protein
VPPTGQPLGAQATSSCCHSMPLQSVLPSSSCAAAREGEVSQVAVVSDCGGIAVAQLESSELLPRNSRFGRTLEIMDALKATLRDEVGSGRQLCNVNGMSVAAVPLRQPNAFAHGLLMDVLCSSAALPLPEGYNAHLAADIHLLAG